MVLHIQHHKENRDFSVRPVTGNYTDVHLFININRFKYSPYSDGEFKDYPFAFDYKRKIDALALIETVNSACNSIVLIYSDYNSELRMRSNYPELLDKMPEDYDLPRAYSTNPNRLVEIIKI